MQLVKTRKPKCFTLYVFVKSCSLFQVVTAAPQKFKIDILPVDDGTPRIVTNLGLQWLEYMDNKVDQSFFLHIDFGVPRCWHLNKQWSTCTPHWLDLRCVQKCYNSVLLFASTSVKNNIWITGHQSDLQERASHSWSGHRWWTADLWNHYRTQIRLPGE